MSRIEVMPRLRCDRCGCMFPEDVHHGRMMMTEGFGDLRTPANGHLSGVHDLCDACRRKVADFVSRPPEIYGEKFED